MNNKKRLFTTAQITKMAMMIAFISAASYIRIPLSFSPAAITGQTLAVNLVALVLTPMEAFVTLLCYWLLGVLGAPIFGGPAGPGKMFGPAGGYFIAFLLAVVLIAKLRGTKYNVVRYSIVAILVGLIVIDGIGFVWMKLLTNMTWSEAFVSGFLIFVPLDTLKAIVAAVLARPIQNALYEISGNTDSLVKSEEERKDKNPLKIVIGVGILIVIAILGIALGIAPIQ